MVRVYPNIFEQLKITKEILSPVIKGKNDDEIRIMLSRCANYYGGRDLKFTKLESALYELLLKKELHPKTVYKYFLAQRYPENIKKLLRENKIGFTNAQARAQAQKRFKNSNNAKQLMEDMKSVVGGLEWQGIDK